MVNKTTETNLNDEQEEFENAFADLRKQLLDASVHLDIWERLQPTEEVVDIIRQYKGFFLPTSNAHIDQFIIKISPTYCCTTVGTEASLGERSF